MTLIVSIAFRLPVETKKFAAKPSTVVVNIMSKETPKKISVRTRGRKASAENANDYCRLCKCALKLKYGVTEKTSYISSENLFK